MEWASRRGSEVADGASTGSLGKEEESLVLLNELGLAALLPLDQLSECVAASEAPVSSSSDRDHAATASVARGRSTRPDANGTRRRQKEELSYLRGRAAELEQELALLKAERAGDALDAVDEAPTPSPWERIAARQREARRNAEQENERLRSEVEAQLRLARNLERLLRKRPSLGMMDTDRSKRVCSAIDLDQDAAAYNTLMQRITGGFATYQHALGEVGLIAAPTGHRETTLRVLSDAQALSDAGGESELVCVQLTDVTTMPFSVEATASAAWRCITSGYMQLQHRVYEGLGPLHDALALQYSITMARRRLRVDVAARAAMRRFSVNNKRDVLFVWESQATHDDGAREAAASSSGPSSASRSDGAPCNPKVQVRERGWTLFTPSPESDAPVPSTRMLTCMQMIPLVAASEEEEEKEQQRRQRRQVGVLTDLALEYFDQQIDQAHHAIETLLLDERVVTV